VMLIHRGARGRMACKTQIVQQPNATTTNAHRKKKKYNKDLRRNHISANVISSLLN